MDPATLSLGETCDFTAVATLDGKPLDPADLTWEWDFGDQSELCKDNPAPHAYTAPGEYLVTVAAFYQKQSTSAKVTVIVEEGVSALDGGLGAELLFVPSDTICDLVYVKFRIPRPPGYQGQTIYFDKWINGAWVQQGSGVSGGYCTEGGVEYWGANREWATPADHNVSISWRARYSLVGMGPPPKPPISGDVTAAATPDNTVIKSSAALIIIHNPPQTHNVPWSITHAAREGPTFTVTVEVCDMSGGVVVTHSETQVGPGSGSWTWDGKINGVDAAKGLYISRVYTSHYFQGAGGCSDRDKTDVLSEVSVDGFQWVTGQYPTRAQVTLHYTLSEALTNCVVTAYKPDLSTTAVHVPANGALSGTGGAHNVTVEFAVDPQICGTYRFVITGDQASGAGNRDEQAKPTVPEGASVDIWPPAMNWHSPTWASDFACCCEYGAQMQGEPHGGSHYAADAAHSLPVASELVDHLLSDAVISLHSHSGPGYTHIIARDQNGNETAANFCAMHYSFYTPGRDVALSDYQGDLSQLRFILFNGCETGAMSPPFTGPSLVSAAEDAGVDASLGFNEPIFMDQSGLWTHWFWYYACEMGCTVSDAHAEAFDEVLGLLGGNTDWRLFDVAVSGGMCDIVPARYGQ